MPHPITRRALLKGAAAAGAAAFVPAMAAPPQPLAPPVETGRWVRPAEGDAAQPVWGIRGGIRVGLWPTPGPRGLIRVYAPYLGHAPLRVINFVAVEPVVGRWRCLSELEQSEFDKARGKAMWTGNAMEPDPQPRKPWQPARGSVTKIGGVEALTLFVFIERFLNGARPIVQVVLRGDRPHEATFRIFAAKGSRAMGSCVLTATMGNYARLRRLWLKGKVVESTKLWPMPRLNRHGFVSHSRWGLRRMLVVDGQAVVAATPNERDPGKAVYAPEVHRFWRYGGKLATQYWRAPATKDLAVQVNGRTTYWASQAPIPGGIAYENFELVAPFAAGQSFTFGVTPEPPEALGFPRAPQRPATDGH